MRELVPVSLRRLVGGCINDWSARRRKAKILRSLRGDAVECNVCHWRGAKFADDQWHAGTVCPNCRSQVRHRMLAAMLDGKSMVAGVSEREILAGKRVLHFAPEGQLRDRVQAVADRYVTADFERADCDLKLDMSAMHSVENGSFDVVIACDVLEHVPDDRAALYELRRILGSGGIAVLTVPQKDPPSPTDEDPSVTTPAEREKHFGQKDHLRIFGEDFADRLAQSGFEVMIVSADNFDISAVSRHVLRPPVPNSHPLATNQRRIYIAKN